MNNNITYIDKSTMFLNVTRGMSFEDTKKKKLCERLELNYNDIEINITWKCLVGEHQYFPIRISYDVDFRNMMEMFVQSGTNMMKLYVRANLNLLDHIIWSLEILIFKCPHLFGHLDNYYI